MACVSRQKLLCCSKVVLGLLDPAYDTFRSSQVPPVCALQAYCAHVAPAGGLGQGMGCVAAFLLVVMGPAREEDAFWTLLALTQGRVPPTCVAEVCAGQSLLAVHGCFPNHHRLASWHYMQQGGAKQRRGRQSCKCCSARLPSHAAPSLLWTRCSRYEFHNVCF